MEILILIAMEMEMEMLLLVLVPWIDPNPDVPNNPQHPSLPSYLLLLGMEIIIIIIPTLAAILPQDHVVQPPLAEEEVEYPPV